MTSTMHRAVGALSALGVVIVCMQACSASSNHEDDGGSGAGKTTSNSSSSAQGGSGPTVGVGGFGGIPSGSGGGGATCAETSADAQEGSLPADIIIAVDTSGSMSDEAEWTQQNMNSMVNIIVQSGIDAHVVMISNSEICVPSPLGTGSCPNDEDLPNYRHVMQTIGSNDALEKILQTYPQWSDSLRPGATKTIVVISDDNSDLSAANFTNQLLTLDSSFQGFKFDAIYSYQDPFSCAAACAPNFCLGCGKCCPTCNPLSAAQGTVYQNLVQQTNGVQGDLCDQDFTGVFTDMATAVVSAGQLACVYTIPAATMGETIDYDKVNVDYTPDTNATPQPIYYVPGGKPDCGQTGGWYYDDPVMPTQIIFCETTCAGVQGNPNGKISVKFGCDTLIAPPE